MKINAVEYEEKSVKNTGPMSKRWRSKYKITFFIEIVFISSSGHVWPTVTAWDSHNDLFISLVYRDISVSYCT